MLILLIYIIGCIFSYGKSLALEYEILEAFPFAVRNTVPHFLSLKTYTDPKYRNIARSNIVSVLLSWFGFIYIYYKLRLSEGIKTKNFVLKNKYFLKFSLNGVLKSKKIKIDDHTTFDW